MSTQLGFEVARERSIQGAATCIHPGQGDEIGSPPFTMVSQRVHNQLRLETMVNGGDRDPRRARSASPSCDGRSVSQAKYLRSGRRSHWFGLRRWSYGYGLLTLALGADRAGTWVVAGNEPLAAAGSKCSTADQGFGERDRRYVVGVVRRFDRARGEAVSR
jgi:hypothetical protein